MRPGDVTGFEESFAKWQRVHPRVREGLAIAAIQGLGGVTDTSDGLYAALRNIGSSSNVRLVIDRGTITIHPEVARIARIMGQDPLQIALGNSADFELLVTIDPGNLFRINQRLAEQGLRDLYVIGEVQDPQEKPGAYYTDGTPIMAETQTHAT